MFKRLIPILHGVVATMVAALTLAYVYVQDIAASLPNINDPDAFVAEQSLIITDRDGNELYRLFDEQDRVVISLESLAVHVPDAFIAIEDTRFHERGCIDAKALLRAALANARDPKSQGASTITQQLVRNALLTNEKTVERKISELLLACRLEKLMSKKHILEAYLNWIPFGGTSYGIEQASKRFFGIGAHELSVAQSAVLAALPQRPTYLSPYGDRVRTSITREDRMALIEGTISMQEARRRGTFGLLPDRVTLADGSHAIIEGRASIVLAYMSDQGRISQSEYDEALAELLSMKFERDRIDIGAPHFVLWIREDILDSDEWKNKRSDGLRITTTLDPRLQRIATRVVDDFAEEISATHGARNVSLVAVNRTTREIVAYVGNTEYFGNDDAAKVDMARAPRQPGSSFKPFVYAAAFLRGMNRHTVIYDLPLTIGGYSPQNYDRGFFGKMNPQSALGRSRNIPAIKTFFIAGGEDSVLNTASAMGIGTPLLSKINRGPRFAFGWPLALGTAETPLIEMVQGYATIANNGEFLPLKNMLAVTDSFDRSLDMQTHETVQAIPEDIAKDLADILGNPDNRPPNEWRDMLTPGSGWAAVKTGTSNACREVSEGVCVKLLPKDTWTIGFNDELVVGVLATNADNEPLHEEASGLATASPVWKAFMEEAQNPTDV